MMKIKKSIYLPIILGVYGLSVSAIFAHEWIASGRGMRFAIMVGVIILIVALLGVTLHKKERLEAEREKL